MYQRFINGAGERLTGLSPGKCSRTQSARDTLSPCLLSFDDILRVLRVLRLGEAWQIAPASQGVPVTLDSPWMPRKKQDIYAGCPLSFTLRT